MSTNRLVLLFALGLCLASVVVLVLSAALEWDLGAVQTALVAHVTWTIGFVQRSPLQVASGA